MPEVIAARTSNLAQFLGFSRLGFHAVVPKLCAAAPWGAPKYSTRPTNYDLSIQ
jgi:hypothetical protein